MEDRKTFWDNAGTAGLALGGVSVAYLAVTQLLALCTNAPVAIGLAEGVLWLAKFIGCILLMQFLMKRYASRLEDATHSDSFAFGATASALSALVYSACYLVYVQFIAPDLFEQSISAVLNSYSSMMDSNSRDAMERLIPELPKISFFANLIYCFLYGLVVSAILSRKIPSDNPFSKQI